MHASCSFSITETSKVRTHTKQSVPSDPSRRLACRISKGKLSARSCRLKQELDVKRIALELLHGRVTGSETAQLAAAAAETEAKLSEARAAADAAREDKTAMAAAARVGASPETCWILTIPCR